jgi:SAM-dependent methyltransferase
VAEVAPDHHSGSSAPTAADQHFAVLERRIEIKGKAILDVGCGNGAFLMRLRAAGAKAFGLEVNEAAIARAVAAGVDPTFLHRGDGRTLPCADNSLDVVAFVNSFHHVPADVQQSLLAEVARVLKPGGDLVAFEPKPYGAMTEVVSPIDDETEVRTNSQYLLCNPPRPFELVDTVEYQTERRFSSVDAVIPAIIVVDPEREKFAGDPLVRQEVEKRFSELAERVANGAFRLTQPSVFVHLRNG